MPAFCRAMSGGSASRNPTPAYDGATPRRTGIRNRFPPAANAPSGKTGNSETKFGKDCGLTTDSGSVSRKKNEQTTIFEHRFASYSSRESFRLQEMESETTTF